MTKCNTILKYPESVLAKCLRDSEKDNYIEIDRDGQHFESILNFMRDEKLINLSHWPIEDIEKLKVDADFYGLKGLLNHIEKFMDNRGWNWNNRLQIVSGNDRMRRIMESSNRFIVIINYSEISKLVDNHAIVGIVEYLDPDLCKGYIVDDFFPLVSICGIYNPRTKEVTEVGSTKDGIFQSVLSAILKANKMAQLK